MKKVISTPEAPAAIGPYSQGVRVGSVIYFSGQIPFDPKTGQLVSGGIDVQTRRVMENIGGLLKAGGLGFDNIVKTTIYLADIGDFQAMNEIYGSYFKQAPPARTTIQAGALPRGARIEIEVIAVDGNGEQTVADTSG
jgi:2-iminobutanoate/2-iminopropanoate deaminase